MYNNQGIYDLGQLYKCAKYNKNFKYFLVDCILKISLVQIFENKNEEEVSTTFEAILKKYNRRTLKNLQTDQALFKNIITLNKFQKVLFNYSTMRNLKTRFIKY